MKSIIFINNQPVENNNPSIGYAKKVASATPEGVEVYEDVVPLVETEKEIIFLRRNRNFHIVESTGYVGKERSWHTHLDYFRNGRHDLHLSEQRRTTVKLAFQRMNVKDFKTISNKPYGHHLPAAIKLVRKIVNEELG